MNPYYTRSYFLAAGETDARGRLPLTLLTAKIIETASLHANSLGIGYSEMDPIGIGWVLSRLSIEMTDYPTANTEYCITTWVETYNRHFSERSFKITDGQNRTLGYARSVWMVIDTNTHQNRGTADIPLDAALVSGEVCPMDRPKRFIPVEDSEPAQYTFRYTDIDFYRHVNTVRYIALLLNQFTLDFMDEHSIRRIDVGFAHEARFGQTVSIARSDEQDAVRLEVSRDDDRLLNAVIYFTKTERQ